MYDAQTIFDKSKIILQRYIYEHIVPLYGNRVKILYTDMDSIIMLIFTEDFFEDIMPYVDKYYDTLGYSPNHAAVENCGFPVGRNKKKPGFMEDECPNDMMVELIGTSAKQYYYRTESGKEMRAKGIRNKDENRCLTRDDYYNAVLGENKIKEVEQRQIRSFGLENYMIKMCSRV